MSFVLVAYDESQQRAAEALPLEGPCLADDEPGSELGEAYTNLRAALRDGDPLQKRLQLSAEEGGAPLGNLSISLQSLPLLKQLESTLRMCNARRNAKEVVACEALRKKIDPPPPPSEAAAAAAAAAAVAGGAPRLGSGEQAADMTHVLGGAAPAVAPPQNSPSKLPALERGSSLDVRRDGAASLDARPEGPSSSPEAQPRPDIDGLRRGSTGLSLDSRLARHLRVRLKLRVRSGAALGGSVAARLSVGPATADEVMQDSISRVAAAHGGAKDGTSASAAAAASTATALVGGDAGGGARGDAGETGEIVVEIEALELADKQRLPCRSVELAIDVLGLLKPAPRTPALSVRGNVGAPVPLELRCATPLPAGGAARKALAAALGTHSFDDSDVYVVLRGLGGACGVKGRELASAVINLEQLLQDGRDLEHIWLELEPETDEVDGPQAAASPPLGRVRLSTRALPALRALATEMPAGGAAGPAPRGGVHDAAGGVHAAPGRAGAAPLTPHAPTPPPPPTESAPPADPEEAWLVGVESASVALMDAYGTSVPPTRGACFELRVTLGGRTSRSRALRCATKHLALEKLPLQMSRDLYCGPGSPAFAPLYAAVHSRVKAAAARPPFDVWGGRDLAAAEGLVLQLMERAPPAAEEAHLGGNGGNGGGGGGNGGGGGTSRPEVWRMRCGGALPSKRLLAAPSDEAMQVPLLAADGSEAASLRLVLRTTDVLRALRDYRGAPPPAPHDDPPPLSPRGSGGGRRRRGGGGGGGGGGGSEGAGSPPPAAPLAGGGAGAAEADVEEEAGGGIRLGVGGLQLLPSAPSLRSVERLQLEVMLLGDGGEALLRAPLSSRSLPLPHGRSSTELAVGWTRHLVVAEGGELWRKLREALASADEDEPPHVAVALVGIGSATGRRSLGSCSHSLRAQLLRGVDAVGSPLAVVDPRGVPLATLWLSAAANASLARLCPPVLQPRLPAPAARMDARQVGALRLACVLRLQAYARAVVARRQRRLAACDFRHALGVTLHALHLPPSLCSSQQVAAASVQVDLMRLGREALGCAARPRAGSTVRFDHERQVPVEPGGAAWSQVREALRSRSSSACELRLTVTADRQLGSGDGRDDGGGGGGSGDGGGGDGAGGGGAGGGARLLGAERRYVLGTARVGLAELLRGGIDLVEQPLPLLGRNWDLAGCAGAPPTLVISLSAVAALAAVAAGLPGVGFNAAGGGALRPAAELIAQRARLAARLQAASRGWLARQRLRRRGVPPPVRSALTMRVLALSSAAHPPPPPTTTAVGAAAATSLRSPAAPTLLTQLAPELRFQIAIELGALGTPPPRAAATAATTTSTETEGGIERRTDLHGTGHGPFAATSAAGTAPPPPPPPSASEWVSLPATAEAAAAVEGLCAALDMRCGGHVRSALRLTLTLTPYP